MRLKDKVAIVTGGGTGIGRGISVMFAKEGAKVVVCGRRPEVLEETVGIIKQNGGEAIAVQTDVSDYNQVAALVGKTITQFGKIDILVNCAGVYLAHDALSASEEEWNKVISIDLKGVWICSKACIPEMLKQGKGKIINIASIAGIIGFEQSAAYCAAKGGVVNLTREMALDFASKCININSIAPGVIDTDMTKPFLTNEAAKKLFLEKTPVGRVGTPDDIAYGAVYLASPESDFVTGHILVIDGGWTIK
ncbi:MAG: glucose 1-dehydrogenase [Candidatus Levybacteria bacterium]|nr:glucose 1-dehydrogenase [Candidatus Levybacteria bacterium]